MFTQIKFALLIFCEILTLQAFQGLVIAKGNKAPASIKPSNYCLQMVNTPPQGQLPEDVYTSSDRYWILTKLPLNPRNMLDLNFDYSGITGILNENEIIMLSRADSSKSWSKITNYSIDVGKSEFDGIGFINIAVKNNKRGREFTLAQSTASLPLNQPGKLNTSIKYGPVEINWQTQFEAGTKYFTVERQLENQKWQEIAEINSPGISVFPRKYQYEDVCIFPKGTRLKYRIKQINFKNESTFSLPIEVDYLPEAQTSFFAQAKIDTAVQAIHLRVCSSIGGLLRIDLFNKEMEHQTCLIENEIIPGLYSYNFQSRKLNKKNLCVAAFCRLEIISPDQGTSFIQIRQVTNGRFF